MSKIVWLLILISFALGFSIVWFFGFNPIASTQAFLTNPIGSLESLSGLLVRYWQPIAAVVGTGTTAIAYARNKVSETQQQASLTQNQMQNQMLEMANIRSNLEVQVEAQKTTLQTQTKQLEAKELKIQELNKKIAQQDQQIREATWVDAHIKKKDKDEITKNVLEAIRKK